MTRPENSFPAIGQVPGEMSVTDEDLPRPPAPARRRQGPGVLRPLWAQRRTGQGLPGPLRNGDCAGALAESHHALRLLPQLHPGLQGCRPRVDLLASILAPEVSLG